MNAILLRSICLVVGYLFGMIQTAYIYGRMKGIDIRQHGSGNAGTTNTLRVLGKKAGLIVFVGDLVKTIIPVLVVGWIMKSYNPDYVYLLRLYTGLGCILGHNFPFYLGFKGGKGIAATGGMILGFYWPFIIMGLTSFFGIFFITHYVSLGSIILMIAFFTMMCIMCGFEVGAFAGLPEVVLIEMCAVTFVICAMAIYRHRANIGRLLNHCERKTYILKKNKVDIETSNIENSNTETSDTESKTE